MAGCVLKTLLVVSRSSRHFPAKLQSCFPASLPALAHFSLISANVSKKNKRPGTLSSPTPPDETGTSSVLTESEEDGSPSVPSQSEAQELNIYLDPVTERYDPARTFLKKDVQNILYRVGYNEKRAADKINMTYETEMLELPSYRFLTQEELDIEQTRGRLQKRQKLQLPPVMARRKPGGEVISEDPQLDMLIEHKMVFTDVTDGIKDRQRVVVVRLPDGTLRQSTWDEKLRMCELFFPKPGREIFLPRMFQADFLPTALKSVTARYILASACAQMEPDDPDYVRVTHAVYDDVDRKGSYEDLYATRFFGGLVFYLACVVRLDGLLLDRLRREKFADAADIVRLLNILHPKCKCALAAGEARVTDDLGLLQTYIRTTAVARLKERLAGLLPGASSEEEDGPAERLSV